MLKIKASLDKETPSIQKTQVLSFLKRYDRICNPGQTELEQWNALIPNLCAVDPLSEFRLPFTGALFSKEIWTIIRPEISLDTYREWLEAIPAFDPNLCKDEICCYVVKDVVSSQQKRNNVLHGLSVGPGALHTSGIQLGI